MLTLPGLSERQTYELVDRNRDKTAEMKNWQEDRRVIREREKYVFPPVKQERIEVRLNHSKPIHSRGRQQDRYREPTVRYDRQQSPQAYAFDYRDRGRSAETDKWQSRDRRIVREKHISPFLLLLFYLLANFSFQQSCLCSYQQVHMSVFHLTLARSVYCTLV